MNPVTPAEIPLSLEQLRGLHLPGGAAGALQGEVVAAAALGFLAALLVGLVRYGRGRARAGIRRAALAELARSRNLDPEARLVAQARLLRRLGRTLGGETEARATGADWAARLDALFRTDFFTRGAGRVLADGLYRRQDPDLDALDAELGRLIGRLRA
ncbi:MULTISPECIES: DUF4381 family protein [Methylobacterium]|uniref:Protein of unassigned function n=2 Tax=Methylobacterium TaxID=407 RepID=A0A089NZ78_9HYPH|nr:MULTISPECIES: DUF4381 family protein [Methylobacterium]AIQ92712.1 protein of unassigned function [Methylobacterium oryzae CBMB20]MBA9064550.1 hypothetical protein [Methylobacterium fujisawaense]MDH3031274.1 DUF4381 family protein [Methylobacterium fujisawaense]WFS06602.1 DUF4381 family protein [Methylobacterium sp. 391_Methyba4]SFV10474.1 protein of unknown function [Methylobacterium sp. UNCCL125]